MNSRLVDEPGSVAMVREGEDPIIIYREAGLQQPENVLAEETTVSAPPGVTVTETMPISTPIIEPNELTGTERIILMIAVILVILVALVALIRLVWRSRT